MQSPALTDYSKVDTLGLRCNPVNFGAEKGASLVGHKEEPGAASACLAGCSEVDMLGVCYTSVHFGAKGARARQSEGPRKKETEPDRIGAQSSSCSLLLSSLELSDTDVYEP